MSSITVGSVATTACGVSDAMWSQEPGVRSSSSPSTVNRSRPERIWTMAARLA